MAHNVDITISKSSCTPTETYLTKVGASSYYNSIIYISTNGYDVVQIGESTNILLNANNESLGISDEYHFGVRIYPFALMSQHTEYSEPTEDDPFILGDGSFDYQQTNYIAKGTTPIYINIASNVAATFLAGDGNANTGLQGVFKILSSVYPNKPNFVLPTGSIPSDTATRASYYAVNLFNSSGDNANSVLGRSSLSYDVNSDSFNFSFLFKNPKTYIVMPPLYTPVAVVNCYNALGGAVYYPMVYDSKGQPIQ